MTGDRWRLEVTRRGLAPLSALLPEAAGAWDDLDDWLDREDIPDGTGSTPGRPSAAWWR